MIDALRTRIVAASKAGNTLERDLLKVAMGDLQTAQARSTDPLTEAQAQAVIRKMVKSGHETLEGLQTRGDEAGIAKTQAELAILEELLPQTLSVDDIVAKLGEVADAVRAAPNDGAATGVAMKHLKGSGAAVDGKDVAQAVRQLRAG
ncbi:MAG: GatB/YqeY domain-containing protein [Planctomycetota bacterium]